MAEHIDIVKNEWLAGMQIRLVTVALKPDGGVLLANVTPGWEDLMRRPLPDASGEPAYLETDPDRAIENLTRSYAGDYVFATPLHDESDCLFRYGDVLSMRPLPDDAVAKLTG